MLARVGIYHETPTFICKDTLVVFNDLEPLNQLISMELVHFLSPSHGPQLIQGTGENDGLENINIGMKIAYILLRSAFPSASKRRLFVSSKKLIIGGWIDSQA